MNEPSAREMFFQISKTSCKAQRDDLQWAAVDYARIRVDWKLASREGRREIDATRTARHNAFIDACNSLSRAMVAAGENPVWRKRLGDERKTIGDFACWIHCLLGLAAR